MCSAGAALRSMKLLTSWLRSGKTHSNLLRECEAVVRRKSPNSLPRLAYLLELGLVEIASSSPDNSIEPAKARVTYEPDAVILAEATGAEPGWFIAHNKTHT